jgi:hypothetical protein
VALTRSWEPALSFWYQPQSTDPNDEFNVILTTVTETAAAGVVELLDRSSTLAVTETHILTPSLVGNDWRHLWTYPAPVDTYFTGTVTIHFRLHNDGENAATTVHLDEVCLGRTAGGPFKGYSPLVLRGH